MTRRIVSQPEWLAERLALLEREKAFTRERDALSAARRSLPWIRVEKPYRFQGPEGPVTLADLFGGRGQLVVYHFMFGPEDEEGCKSCSFWADNFNGIGIHLAHRDTALVAVSKAPFAKLDAYRRRMGWSFPWYSAHDTDFNEDFHVTFTPDEIERGAAYYNYRPGGFRGRQAPGISVFARDGGEVFHTYSTFSRGLDMLNGAYHFLDLTPKGRDEEGLPHTMAWVRRHDQYES
ncbi:MAG TPA: DUF899 domain-containing protein [Paracoccaceae bacterium]|nr:DUF899 domain-containing protein [Paracoccaceae bacterium]